MNQSKNNLAIPGAIVLAGLFIAGGIYFSNTKNQSAQIARPATNTIVKPVTSTDHLLGNPNATIKIVEYSDTECPYCKMFEASMHTIMDTYGKAGQVAWVYRHFPIHSLSGHEAEATECAAELGGNNVFWSYIDDVFSTTTSSDNLNPSALSDIAKENGINVAAFNTCLSSGKYTAAIQTDYQDAIAAGAQGTPFSVIVLSSALSTDAANTINQYITTNGYGAYMTISADNKEIAMDGALPLATLQSIIDAVLKK